MKSVSLDTKEAPNKWRAQQDANMRNAVNRSLYTSSQQTRAQRLAGALELVYSGEVYVNYRKRAIAVKVDQAQVRDSQSLGLLEQDWNTEGITKRVSAQGVIYTIPR